MAHGVSLARHIIPPNPSLFSFCSLGKRCRHKRLARDPSHIRNWAGDRKINLSTGLEEVKLQRLPRARRLACRIALFDIVNGYNCGLRSGARGELSTRARPEAMTPCRRSFVDPATVHPSNRSKIRESGLLPRSHIATPVLRESLPCNTLTNNEGACIQPTPCDCGPSPCCYVRDQV
jgi:hypothetical protein